MKYELRFLRRTTNNPLVENLSLRHVVDADDDEMAASMAASIVRLTAPEAFSMAVLATPDGRQVATFDAPDTSA